jgi:hypothetical protein
MARVSFLGALLLVLLSASLATTDVRAQQQLLINGDFESGTTGWHPFGGEVRTEPGLGVGNSTAGLLSATGTSVSARIEQPVDAIEPGATYRLTGQVRVGGSNVQYVRLKIEWQAGATTGLAAPSAQENDTGGSYRTLTSQLFVPCDATAVIAMVELRRNEITGPAANAYVDDLRLEMIPPTDPCPPPTSPLHPTQPPPPGSTPPAPTSPPAGSPNGPGGAPVLPMTSLLANGGFEVAQAGRPAAWRTQGGVLGQVASPMHGGRFAAAFASASESTKWAYQTVPVTALAWYELDGYV